MTGQGGADRLFGSAGRDHLVGGGGADRLTGDSGRDVLTGGKGADTFVFVSLADGGDGLRDFRAEDGDVLDISLLDANSVRAGDQAARFVDHFSGRAGEAMLSYDEEQDRTTFRLDTDGDGRGDFRLAFHGQVAEEAGWVL